VIPESYVEQGMRIGYTTDYFGNKLADVITPVSGVVVVCLFGTVDEERRHGRLYRGDRKRAVGLGGTPSRLSTQHAHESN
jgi:hypothetical protein